MTPKELFKLYGAAYLFSATRLLHQRVSQLELENQMMEERFEKERQLFREELLRKETDYKELQERVFVKKENLPPLGEPVTYKIPKHKASRIREKIAEAKRNEEAYYQRLNSEE